MDNYDGIITKPEIEEVLYHAGFHKYIDKYLGKNGKWIYKYAGQAKNAATGLVNKAKTMLPGLQSQATGAVTTAKKKASSLTSTGAKTASGVKKQAQSRINKILPILSKKFNATKKSASSQASKLKKQADGTIKNVSSQIKKTKNRNLYQRNKRVVGQKLGIYKKADRTKKSATSGDSRYTTPYKREGSLRYRGYNTSDTYDRLGNGGEIGRINDATRNAKVRKKANTFKQTRRKKK